MIGLSIKQPFAWLIASHIDGKPFKSIETRSRRTNYRGDFVVHAGLKPHDGWVVCAPHGAPRDKHRCISTQQILSSTEEAQQFGKILCVANLFDCTPMTIEDEYDSWSIYEPDRWSWHLKDIRPIEPVDFKGMLNFFEVPDSLIKFI